jgi:hypothetical protein
MAMVVAVTPDVCLTPMGATPVPVPYPIVGWFSNAALLAMSVRMRGRPTFTTASQVTNVVGDEAGTAGGVKSGVNKSICESVTASTTVKAEGHRVLRHGDQMKMNQGNTIGTVVFMPGVGPMIVGIPSESPPAWKVLLDIDGLGTRLEAFGKEAVSTAKGMGTPTANLIERLADGDVGGIFEDVASDYADRQNLYAVGESFYDTYQEGGIDAVRGRLGFQALMFAAPEGLSGRVGKPGVPNRALPAPRLELEAGGAAEGGASETPSSERPTAEIPAVDPDATGKMAATAPVDGLRVTGESVPPKLGGKYADIAMELSESMKKYDEFHRVKIYYDDVLAARRVVAGPNGELIYAESRVPVGNGDHIYVMDKNGNIYVDRPQFGEVHHSSLAGGEAPAAGGHMYVVDGKPAYIDEKTGHFGDKQPAGRSEVVKNELAEQGADVSNTHAEPWNK